MLARHPDIRAWVRRLQGADPIGPRQRRALEGALSNPTRFAAGEILVPEGERADFALVVLWGFAGRLTTGARGRRRISSILAPGDACSCGLLVDRPLEYALEALSPGECARLAPDDVRRLQETEPELMLSIGQGLLDEAVAARQSNQKASARSGLRRLAHLLCELNWRLAATGGSDLDAGKIPLMQRDLAAALDLSLVQVSRVLQQLRKSGMVALGRGGLKILRRGPLESLGGFDPEELDLGPSDPAGPTGPGVALH